MNDRGFENIRRRDFLSRLGTAGLALPLGLAACGGSTGGSARQAAAGTGVKAGGPKVGLCTIAFQERPLFEVLELAAQIGFDGVEPWGKPDHLPLTTPDERVREIKAKLDSLGIECGVYGSYVRLGEKRDASEQEADMRRSLEITRLLGTRIVRIWAGDKDSEYLTDAEWDAIVEDGKKYCAMAEPMGILLAMEMHGNCLTNLASATVELIERVGSPALKANYQILNSAEDPYERARIAGPHVVMVHAQNSAPGIRQPLISEGVVDFGKIYEILTGFGFEGYFEVEFVKGGTFEEKVDSLKKDYEHLRSIGKKA